MVQAYNFLASWQLFPEKCLYENGLPPKSGSCKIEASTNNNELTIATNWVSMDNEAYYSQYSIVPDGTVYDSTMPDIAPQVRATIPNSSQIEIGFLKNDTAVLNVQMQILPNGYLQIKHIGKEAAGKAFENVEIYHKQLSVLPYASSVGSVAIRPTKEGVIKHKALSAMEEQTEMQLDQLRQQIELLAKQAQAIRKRRDLSLMIYDAKISFKPQIGQTYHLYEKKDGSHTLSLVAPSDWGGSGPYKSFLASVKLLADHTWKEVQPKKEREFEDLEFEE
jgi:hypothetical protein